MFGIKRGEEFVVRFDGNGNTQWTKEPTGARRFSNRNFAASCVEEHESLIEWTGDKNWKEIPLLDDSCNY